MIQEHLSVSAAISIEKDIGSAVFPEALISNRSSQTYSSNSWLEDNTTSLIKSEELCDSDILNIELLYGRELSTEKSFTSPNFDGNTKESVDNLFQESLPNDAFLTNDLTSCDLFYNDKSTSFSEGCWHTMSDKVSFPPDLDFETKSPLSFWGNGPLDLETLKMDDVFQVDKDDLVQSPTLAELNANNDESLFDSFDNFGLPLLSGEKQVKSVLSTCSSENAGYKMPSLTETSQIKTEFHAENKILQLDASLEKGCISDYEARSTFNSKECKLKTVSSDTAIVTPDKQDVKSHVITKVIKQSYPVNESNIETTEKNVQSASQLSSFGHETFDSEEDDSEMDCDYSSDADEESEDDTKIQSLKHASASSLLLQKKKSRYFWQYNIQSKGPKAPKMKLDGKPTITYSFSGTSDPVFTSSYLNKGVKHAGKARRGDGNDLTPNPQKLYNIGLELEKLTSIIEGLVPANELPVNARSKSRKEKNKLASRACRLKKKAQHEANKLKLFGLQKEQKHLFIMINEVKKIIRKGVDNIKHGKVQSINAKIESLYMKKRYSEVAGNSAEFVNRVLKNVDSGDKNGGLNVNAHDE